MRILLDECLPKKLKRELTGHDVATVGEAGWTSITNGELLRLASDRFDVFLTVDRKLPHQQNLSHYPIKVIVLLAPNRYMDLLPLMPRTILALAEAQPGTVVYVEAIDPSDNI
jgi:predicted nuclease of predicted toxin-antitoxin system